MDHRATIGAIYDAFGRGDLEGFLGAIAEDVEWESWDDNHAQQRRVPWLLPRRGRAGVREFLAIVAQFQIHHFAVGRMVAGGDTVAVEVVIDATVPGGGRFRDEELHVWRLDDQGRVIGMRHYVDTAKHIAAAPGG